MGALGFGVDTGCGELAVGKHGFLRVHDIDVVILDHLADTREEVLT